MINSKLIQIIRCLNEEEIKSLVDFTASPFFNKKQELIPFSKYLRSLYPDFKAEDCSKIVIFNHLYPDQAFSVKKIGYIMSDMCKVLNIFLVQIEKDRDNSKFLLAKVFSERNLNKLYIKETEQLEEQFKNNDQQGFAYYYDKYKLYDLKHKYFNKQNVRKDDQNLYKTDNNLDLFYISRKLRIYIELLNRSRVLGKQIQSEEFEIILQSARNRFSSVPIIQAYLETISMHSEEDSLNNYLKLKELLFDNQNYFSKEELDDFYRITINYCIKRIKLDKKFYQNEVFQLYVQNLKSGNLYINNYLSQWTYKNIIKLGVLYEKYEWTINLLEEYISKIHPSQQHNALHYNYAEIYFAKGDYGKAQHHLLQVEFKDGELAYNLGTRLMLVKIFYKQDEEEALLSQIAAFTIFLKRNKELKGERKAQFVNFCNLCAKLLRKNARHFAKIKDEINNTKPLTNSHWLLSVYEDLYLSVMKDSIKVNQSA